MDSMKSSIHRKYVLKYVLLHRCTMYIYGYAHSSPTLKFKPLFMINVPLRTTFFLLICNNYCWQLFSFLLELVLLHFALLHNENHFRPPTPTQLVAFRFNFVAEFYLFTSKSFAHRTHPYHSRCTLLMGSPIFIEKLHLHK